MTLPANVEQLNIGQLVSALAQASATEFVTAMHLLRTTNNAVDWRILLGAITAENAVVAADAAAATTFSQEVGGLDRVANLNRFLSVDPRGRLVTVPVAGDLWVAGGASTAAGATLAPATLIAALAGRTAVITSLCWMVATGAAAQPALQLSFSASVAAPTPVFFLACPANDVRVVSMSGIAILGSGPNTAIAVTGAAPAANTVQAIYVAGYYQ